jgi:SAM-dependent methyltransferase
MPPAAACFIAVASKIHPDFDDLSGFPPMVEFDQHYFNIQYKHYAKQNPPRKLSFYRHLAESAVRGSGRPKILDIGCAFGMFLSRLNPLWDRYGVDVSKYAVDQARRQVPGVQFAVMEPGQMPYNGPFDVVTAFDVIEHVPDIEALISWVAGSLAPYGAFIFVVPVYDGLTRPIIRFLDHDPTHVHKESRRFWLQWAARRFELIDWWGIYRMLLPGGYYLHIVTRTLREYTPAIACMMRLR